MTPRWRSLLFVPAHDTAKLAKAAAGEADAVILDLEDAVAAEAKPRAREAVAAGAAAVAAAGKGVLVRINADWRPVLADLDAAVVAGIDALMVPKAEDPARLRVLVEMLGEFETARGLARGAVRLLPMIESPVGLAAAAALAAGDRVVGLALGTEDFSHALGVDPTPAALDLPCRQIALAAAAAGVMALALPLSIAAFRDEDALRDAVTLASCYGVTGALCIHPRQVAVVNGVLAPGADAIAQARRVIEAWRAAQARGEAVTALDGRMIDPPVVKRAEWVLARIPGDG